MPVQDRAHATRARLLQASTEEFAEHGLAGARVDRIAERSGVNKRMIYFYFENKQGLFDEVILSQLDALIDATPFTPDDLAGWAVGLYDRLTANAQVFRLFAWRNLERSTAPSAERESYAHKIALITQGQAAGTIEAGISAADLIAFVLALTTSWSIASPALYAVTTGRVASKASRRRALHLAVARVVSP